MEKRWVKVLYQEPEHYEGDTIYLVIKYEPGKEIFSGIAISNEPFRFSPNGERSRGHYDPDYLTLFEAIQDNNENIGVDCRKGLEQGAQYRYENEELKESR